MTTPAGPPPAGPIAEYLDQLHASLRVKDASLILAEAEDHLQETVAAGLAAGLTELEAQEAAISSFGSVRAVVRAHQTRQGRAAAAITDAAMAGWKVAWLFLLAYTVSSAIWYAHARLGASSAELSGVPMVVASRAWIAAKVAAGIAGPPLIAGYFLVRRFQRRRGRRREMLVAGLFPLVAVVFFGGLAVALTLVKVNSAVPLGSPPIFASLALAVGYGIRMWRTLLHQGRGQFARGAAR
jgi:hypothetical protein